MAVYQERIAWGDLEESLGWMRVVRRLGAVRGARLLGVVRAVRLLGQWKAVDSPNCLVWLMVPLELMKSVRALKLIVLMATVEHVGYLENAYFV